MTTRVSDLNVACGNNKTFDVQYATVCQIEPCGDIPHEMLVNFCGGRGKVISLSLTRETARKLSEFFTKVAEYQEPAD